ncbi:hypothetical protein B0F90DRAFT_1749052 [Multifurca ochricompacta]|uniref:Mtf2-like C-terminal domain-containing protein n=1 Tax=Multifurca ochricompacta TaxID=376703 RepID=A0AAD4LZ60_9AGAM|nr:hypothetical protein B0F90DRAFT_1749052 [Multifurca ochricompacta]
MFRASGILRIRLPVFNHAPRATLHYNTVASGSSDKTSNLSFTSFPPSVVPGDVPVSKARIVPRRGYSSQVQNSDPSSSTDKPSIFSPQNSPWDHVFEDIPTGHPLVPMTREKPIRAGLNNGSLEPRRQTMTKRELSAFNDMFNMIFSVANERRLVEDGEAAALDIDTRSPLGGFLKNLSKHPRAHRTGEDTELDKLKEQLALCPSDYAMLEWAEREVFGASKRAEEAASAAFAAGNPPPDHLQPPAYPHLLAALMSTARDRYDDPHLALALFEQARNLSSLSYIFGCTTPAYNELLETRWGSFRDLRGVHAALEEMRANGVPPDSRTRALVEDVRRETGARTLWLEESETGSGEVWAMLDAIERLVARRAPRQAAAGDQRPRQRRQQQPHDVWKNPEVTADEGSAYRFGEWPEPENRRQTRRRAAHS